jgi:hypothetical protein
MELRTEFVDRNGQRDDPRDATNRRSDEIRNGLV